MARARFLQAVRDRRARLSNSSDPALQSSGASPVSRRRFMQTSAGVVAAGAVLGRQFFKPSVAYAAGSDPVPVQGSPALAPFNVWAPIVVDSIDAEPASINDFNGVVGIAYVSGMVTRTDHSTGKIEHLPFADADMRFMQGVYRGVDGKPRQGTFGFV
jgi:hypothetical protein